MTNPALIKEELSFIANTTARNPFLIESGWGGRRKNTSPENEIFIPFITPDSYLFLLSVAEQVSFIDVNIQNRSERTIIRNTSDNRHIHGLAIGIPNHIEIGGGGGNIGHAQTLPNFNGLLITATEEARATLKAHIAALPDQ